MGIYTGKGDLEFTGPVLTANVWISSALVDALKSRQQPIPEPIACRALIDTGSTRTIIRKGLAPSLGLNSVGSVRVMTASSGAVGESCDVYSVQLILPNGSTADLTQAVEMPLLEQGIDVLIGRDILKDSVFVYLGTENQFTLSL